MHPRTALKNELKVELTALLEGVPVYASRSRELRPGEAESVIVYVPSESISRPAGRGEARGGRPLSRDITVEIIIVAAMPGDGEASADRADELARLIELHINENFADLEPSGQDQSHSAGEDARVMTSLAYTLKFNDKMEH